MDTIKLLFPDVEKGNASQYTLNRALCFAIVDKNLDAVKHMFKIGADINAFDGFALRYSIGEKNEEMINFLQTQLNASS